MGKFQIQAEQYQFPYHYIPYFQSAGTPMRVRQLRMGMEYLCYQLHAAEVVRALKPSSVLEVGCGDGRFIGMLAPSVPRCVGVDLVERAIRYARAFNPDVEFLCEDVTRIEEQFDVVASIEVLEHITDEMLPGFVSAMVRHLRPGGHLIVTVPTDAEPVHRKHYRHYNEALLEAHVASGNMPLQRISMQHIYAPPLWMKYLLKATCGKHFVLEIPALNRKLWERLWRNRISSAGRGRHLVAVYRRAGPGDIK